MDSIHSWINEDEVKRLAEGLNSAPKSNKEWTESSYVGESVSQPQSEAAQEDIQQVQSQAKSTLASASAMAKAAGVTDRPSPAVDKVSAATDRAAVATPATSLGTFELVEALYEESYASEGICVIDRDGDILYDTLNNPQLTQFSKSIMLGSSLMAVAQGEFGNTRIKASAETVLEYVSMLSTRGPVVIVAKLKSELSPSQAEALSAKILKIVNQ